MERVNANVGVGSLDLDLGGELKQDVEVMGNLAMGSFTLHVANEVGVSVDASTVLAGFDKTGLTKRGDLWYTPGYDDAKRHVRVRLKAFLGGFTLAMLMGLSKQNFGSYAVGFQFFAALCGLALIGLTLVKKRWRTTWGALAAARI